MSAVEDFEATPKDRAEYLARLKAEEAAILARRAKRSNPGLMVLPPPVPINSLDDLAVVSGVLTPPDELEDWADPADEEAEPARLWSPYHWRDPSTFPTRQFLYSRHYIRKYVSATVSPGGAGKSSLVLVEALAMASGKSLLGVRPIQRLKVAYWNGEDPLEETERRICAAALHYGLTADDLEGWLFLGSGRDAPLIIAEQQASGTTIIKPNVDLVLTMAREDRLDVIIVDPFVSCHRVTENDNNAVDVVVKQWAMIGDRANVATELVHHTRKSNGNETTVEDGRGASSLLYAVRSARVLNVMTKEEAERAGVDAHRSYFRADVGKSNLAPPAEGSDWFRMVGVDLNNRDAFERTDEVGVVTRWQWPNPFDGVSVDDLFRVQSKIDGGQWRENPQASEWVGKPVADVLGLDLEQARNKAKVKGLLASWFKSGALDKVERPDENRKVKAFVQVGTWAIRP
jgi:hypothetical protein